MCLAAVNSQNILHWFPYTSFVNQYVYLDMLETVLGQFFHIYSSGSSRMEPPPKLPSHPYLDLKILLLLEVSPCQPGGSDVLADTNLLEFLGKSIQNKERDLECPLSFELSEPPIFMCPESRMSNC